LVDLEGAKRWGFRQFRY